MRGGWEEGSSNRGGCVDWVVGGIVIGLRLGYGIVMLFAWEEQCGMNAIWSTLWLRRWCKGSRLPV